MAALVVFVTTYMLILPALTLASANPKLESERTQGALGDALTATVTAEVDNTQEEQVFLLRTVGDNAGLDESYAFDENDVTIITDSNQNEIELHRQPQMDGIVDYWFTLPAGESAEFPLTFSNGAAMPIIGTTEDEPADEATEMDTNDAEDTEVTVEETAATTENTDESTEETEVEPVSVTYVPGDKSIGGSLKFYACSAMTLEEARALLADLPEDQPATLDFVWDAQIESMENEQPEEEELAEEPKEETVTEEKQEEEKKTEEQDNTSITLTAKGDDYTVSVTYDSAANIPANAELTAKEYSADGKTFKQYQKKTETAILKELDEESITLSGMRLFDVEIRADGKKIEPEAPVDVHFDFDDAEGLDNNCTIVHFADAGTEVLMNQDVTAEVEKNHSASVDFTLDSFSMVSIVYTVDFSYEVNGKVYGFTMRGEDSVSLRALIEALHVYEKPEAGMAEDGAEKSDAFDATVTSEDLAEDAAGEKAEVETNSALDEFMADIVSVEFSDPDLLGIYKVEENKTIGEIKEELEIVWDFELVVPQKDVEEASKKQFTSGDWALVAKNAFDTEEKLTVSMATGESFVIQVTDAQNPVMNSDGTVQTITNPFGTTIDLFDYWIDDTKKDTVGRDAWPGNYVGGSNGWKQKTTSSNGDSQLLGTGNNAGINEGHMFKFSPAWSTTVQDGTKGTPTHDGDKTINSWTGNADPSQGLVINTLNGGYPKLTNNDTLGTRPCFKNC